MDPPPFSPSFLRPLSNVDPNHLQSLETSARRLTSNITYPSFYQQPSTYAYNPYVNPPPPPPPTMVAPTTMTVDNLGVATSSIQVPPPANTVSTVVNTNAIDMSMNHTNALVSSKDENQKYISTWSKKIEALLTILFHNCKYLSKYHNYRYHKCRHRLKWFRIPIIILSAVNAYIAIGLQTYTLQTNISTINSVISLVCGIITSIELFLNIQKKMEKEMQSHTEFNVLSIEIMKMLLLDSDKRNQDGRVFLDEKFSSFLKIIENGNILNPKFFVDVFDVNNMRKMNDEIKKRVKNETGIDVEKESNPQNQNQSYWQWQQMNPMGLFKYKYIEKYYDPSLHALKKEKRYCTDQISEYSNAISPVKNIPNINSQYSQNLKNAITQPDVETGPAASESKKMVLSPEQNENISVKFQETDKTSEKKSEKETAQANDIETGVGLTPPTQNPSNPTDPSVKKNTGIETENKNAVLETIIHSLSKERENLMQDNTLLRQDYNELYSQFREFQEHIMFMNQNNNPMREVVSTKTDKKLNSTKRPNVYPSKYNTAKKI
jgi:hypothetical protein